MASLALAVLELKRTTGCNFNMLLDGLDNDQVVSADLDYSQGSTLACVKNPWLAEAASCLPLLKVIDLSDNDSWG